MRGGGFSLKNAVLSLLALASTQPTQGFPTWEQLKKPMTPGQIKAAADEVVAAASKFKMPGLTSYMLPQIEQYVAEWNKDLQLTASKMQDGRSYTWKGKTFEVGSWKNLQDGNLEVSPREGAPFTIGFNEPVEEVPEPIEESGGRRRKRNKTLRRKK